MTEPTNDKLMLRRALLLELLPKGKVFRMKRGTDFAWAPNGRGYVHESDMWDAGMYEPGEYTEDNSHSYEVDADQRVQRRRIEDGSPIAMLLDTLVLLRAAGELLIEANEAGDETVTVLGERLDRGHAEDLALSMVYTALRGKEMRGWTAEAASEVMHRMRSGQC